MVQYWSLPNNKNTDSLTFRLSLAQGLMKKHGSGVPHPDYGCPLMDCHLKDVKQHFMEHIPATVKNAKPQRKCVVCTKHGKRRESIYWCSECEARLCLDVSWPTIQTSTYNPAASNAHIQCTHVIR
jgi:hypothetical protein